MGLLLLFEIFLVLVTVGLVQHSSKTVLGFLSSLFEAQKTITSPKDQSVSTKDTVSQQISQLQAESQILSR